MLSRSADTRWTSAYRRFPRSTESGSSCESCARTRSCCNSLTWAFSRPALERFEASFTKPYGAILVTGPTGSGKSTSLVRGDQRAQRSRRNTSSPPRTRSSTGLPGINQCQTNARAGLTFARALRSFLRCSPDVILVGEIRDQETANIAIESALTGHLVLSTLHTNDAPGAVTRLIEMGVEPFLVSSAVDCILAQRLARRLCKDCKVEYRPKKQVLIDAGYPEDNLPEVIYKAGRLQEVWQDRLQGPDGRPRGPDDVRGDRTSHRRGGHIRGDRARWPLPRACSRCARTDWRRCGRATPLSRRSCASSSRCAVLAGSTQPRLATWCR